MGGYLRRVRGFGRDVHLFLAFNLLANVGFGVFQVIFNLYLYDLHLREDFIGAFSAVQTLAMAGAALAMGTLLHRFGTWRCVTYGVSFYLATAFALAWSERPAILFALAAGSGVGQAFLFTTTMPCVIAWARRDHHQHAAAAAFALVSLATTVGALLGGWLPTFINRPFPHIVADGVVAYRWTLVAGTLVAAFGLIPLLFMGEARQRLARPDAAATPELAPAPERRQARHDMLVFVLVGGLLMSLGTGMVIPFYNVYLTTLGASAATVGYVYALGGLVAGLLALVAPVVGRRWGSLRSSLVLRLSVVPFFALLILTPALPLAVLVYLVRQSSANMAWPLDATFITEVLPGRARTSVFGLRSGAWNLGIAASSLVGGRIIVHAGYNWNFVSMIVFTAIPVIAYVAYYLRHPLVRTGQVHSALPRGARAELAALPAVGTPKEPATKPGIAR